jgi:hypothetical protein
MRELGLRGAYPVLEGYQDSVAVGWHLQLEDPLRLGALGVTAACSVDGQVTGDERGHVALDWRYLGWQAGLSWNRSDFYDLFGPTKRSRRGWAARLEWDRALVYDLPRRLDLHLELAYYLGLDALPSFQNVGATEDRLLTASAGLRYERLRRSLGAVDDEKGFAWDLVLDASGVHGDVIPMMRAGLDFGFPLLPLPHASLWFRSAAGLSGGVRDDPYATFYLGGFGNNWVDNRSIQRFREPYAFPGFGLDDIGGHSFARQMVEAKLPPLVFERVGTPAFYLTWLRASLFASGLWTDLDQDRQGRYASTGAQVDLRFTFLHWYDMTLSAGWAMGYRAERRAGDEWMVSLKIL